MRWQQAWRSSCWKIPSGAASCAGFKPWLIFPTAKSATTRSATGACPSICCAASSRSSARPNSIPSRTAGPGSPCSRERRPSRNWASPTPTIGPFPISRRKSMRVSQFEIYRICQRALEGLGAPYGIDRDGAAAAVWLEARGMPGLALLAGDLERLEKSDAFAGMTPRMSGAGSAELDADGRPAIAFPGAAVDYLLLLALRSPDGRGELAIEHCRSPLFLVPAAVAAVSAGASLRLAWGDVAADIGADGLSIQIASGQIAAGRTWLAALAEAGPVTVRLAYHRSMVPAEAAVSGFKPGPTEAKLTSAYDRSLQEGVNVDDGLWQRLSAVAARVQVPASEVSRIRGAGGGDANA